MATPKERERKFVWSNFALPLVPNGAVVVEITQTYLTFGPKDEERRVRMCKSGCVFSYYYTEKLETGLKGVRNESEIQISAARYRELLREKDPATRTVMKKRYTVAFGGHMIEIDIYAKPIVGLVVVEVEVSDMDEPIEFPDTWKLEEVTGEKRYSNRQIAEGSLS